MDYYEEKKSKTCNWKCHIFLPFFFLIVFILSIAISFFFFLYPAPNNFQTGKIFDIPKGAGISEIAEILEKENFINSAESFIILDKILEILEKKESLKAGKYVFKKTQDLLGVYQKIASGETGIKEIKVTTIEGEPNSLTAQRIAKKFGKISVEKFIELAKYKEGFLYPDTYQFSPFVDEKFVIAIMKKNFEKKTAGLFDDLPENEIKKIITVASLVENEAGNASYKTKQHVAGIIFRRLKKNMLLQIDAVFDYIYGRHLNKVLFSHLKIDSPYNTYKYPGLPPGPIGNPSVKSIQAALNPLETKDLYYITGKDGNFYYARTSSQHFNNVNNYLK